MFVGIDNDNIRKLLLAYPRKAIKLLYDHYYHVLVGISLKYTGNRAAAEDIVQEVFVLVWEKRHSLVEVHATPIRNFLIRIVKYKSIDFFRRTRTSRTRLSELKALHFSANEASIESLMIETERRIELWQLIAGFPKRERECLRMRFEDELRLEEIAEKLGISRKSVERSLTSGKKRLRAHRQAGGLK